METRVTGINIGGTDHVSNRSSWFLPRHYLETIFANGFIYDAEGTLAKAEEHQILQNIPDDSKSTPLSGAGKNGIVDDLRSPNSLGSPVRSIHIFL